MKATDSRAVPGVASSRLRFVIVSGAESASAGNRPVQTDTADLPINCVIRLTHDRKVIVTLQEVIGGTANYRPSDLRAIAAKLISIASDAENHPDGRPEFLPSYRRY